MRFPGRDVRRWAARFDAQFEEAPYATIAHGLASRARARGWLTKSEFLALAKWKTPRSQPLCARNTEADVRAISAVALSTPNERLRIAVLTLLEGVGWPIASAILHWTHGDPYPILDVRALWSAGLDRIPSRFEFELWRRYTLWCRATASRCGVSMRTLDKALWQYSKDTQR
jgi:hypothetical protein